MQEGRKYIISEDRFSIILNNISDLSFDDMQEVMYEQKMHRAIFGSKQNLSGLEQIAGETNWIRIRVGDTNCDGTSQCTVAYLNKNHAEDKTDSSQFIVEDYYSAIQFFKKIGFPLLSEQETLRSKYVFNYENVKYIICFDKWPHINEMLFVSVTASDNVSETGLASVCNSIKLPDLAMQVGYVDIDKAYEKKIGKKASEIRQLRFNVSLV